MLRKIVDCSLGVALALSTNTICSAQAQDHSPPVPSTSVAASDTEIVPGPLQSERAQLLQKILRAKAQGCGIGGYMSAFKDLQSSAASGQSEPEMKQRMQSLSHALDEQIERSKVLKTQRVPPPIAASSPTSPLGSSTGGGSGRGGDISSLLKNLPPDMNKAELMKKFGGGANGANPDDLMKQFGGSGKAEELMKDPKARAILEKLKAN